MIWQSIYVVLMFQFVLVFGAYDLKNLNIWPMPESVEYGAKSIFLSKEFHLKTDGSKYPDASGILKDGFTRLLDVITANNIIEFNSKVDDSLLLQGINVVILSDSDELQYGIDESYKLLVHANGKQNYAEIEAATVYGALHALQTFSQLCHFNFKSRKLVISQLPWTITDKPRFSYRGLLIDTSRHYQPLPMIKKVIDSMAYAKLVKCIALAYCRYTGFSFRNTFFSKIMGCYAKKRGINVLAELDVPGHAVSWGVGYPELWPSKNCTEPLDVSNEFTFKLINGVLSDFSKIFKYKFVHLGGDEVDTSCWSATPRIKKWLEQKGFNESQAYEYFVLKAQKIAVSHGYEVINWEETFNNFGSKLDRKTVVHNWLGSGVAQKVVESGLRCIVSNQDSWYLDHLDATWQQFYTNEPLTNITNPNLQKLVLGGEVCMWGEHVDGSDIEQTIWPRAAAAAERLWTNVGRLAKNPKDVGLRLMHFRCLLNQRGVAAAPLDGPGRVAPIEPGSCYVQ
ncbi:hypothetical protein LXL04_012730 [Taraxacum kok-saghyz]